MSNTINTTSKSNLTVASSRKRGYHPAPPFASNSLDLHGSQPLLCGYPPCFLPSPAGVCEVFAGASPKAMVGVRSAHTAGSHPLASCRRPRRIGAPDLHIMSASLSNLSSGRIPTTPLCIHSVEHCQDQFAFLSLIKPQKWSVSVLESVMFRRSSRA
jgi:hypothetical protein